MASKTMLAFYLAVWSGCAHDGVLTCKTRSWIISFTAYVNIAASESCVLCPLLLLLPPQEFSFPQVWCSNQQPLHCAFSLERYSPAATQLSCKISVRQVKGQEQILQVYTAVAEVTLCSCGGWEWGGEGGVASAVLLRFLPQPLSNLPGVCPLASSPELALCFNRAERTLLLSLSLRNFMLNTDNRDPAVRHSYPVIGAKRPETTLDPTVHVYSNLYLSWYASQKQPTVSPQQLLPTLDSHSCRYGNEECNLLIFIKLLFTTSNKCTCPTSEHQCCSSQTQAQCCLHWHFMVWFPSIMGGSCLTGRRHVRMCEWNSNHLHID